MNITENVQGVVLAAGCSRRFGADKTLECIDGLPMAIKSALSLKSVVQNVLIIISENNTSLQKAAIKYGIKCVINRTEFNSGIGSSISLAVRATPDANGWMFCLADMPFIKNHTYKMVLDALNRDGNIVVPRFNGRSGHPVAFGKTFQDLLAEKTGDTGAQTIIKSHLDSITYIETEDSGVLLDIDTELDLKKQRINL